MSIEYKHYAQHEPDTLTITKEIYAKSDEIDAYAEISISNIDPEVIVDFRSFHTEEKYTEQEAKDLGKFLKDVNKQIISIKKQWEKIK
jgi:hypothetical protein